MPTAPLQYMCVTVEHGGIYSVRHRGVAVDWMRRGSMWVTVWNQGGSVWNSVILCGSVWISVE